MRQEINYKRSQNSESGFSRALSEVGNGILVGIQIRPGNPSSTVTNNTRSFEILSWMYSHDTVYILITLPTFFSNRSAHPLSAFYFILFVFGRLRSNRSVPRRAYLCTYFCMKKMAASAKHGSKFILMNTTLSDSRCEKWFSYISTDFHRAQLTIGFVFGVAN